MRVDDFPGFDIGTRRFMWFLDIAEEHNLKYQLGMTPYLADDLFTPSNAMPDMNEFRALRRQYNVLA